MGRQPDNGWKFAHIVGAPAVEKTLSIFDKTETGMVEVTTKKAGLAFLANSVLIMTDGKRSVEDIKKSFGKMGDVDAVYADLEKLGFVKPVGGANAASSTATPSKPAPAPTPAPKPAPEATPPAAAPTSSKQYVDRKVVINTLRRNLEPALGPGADPIMLRLERAFGEEDFSRAVADALRAFANVRGKSLAAELESRL